jgi:mono/diheme cytochrome c family protein
MKKSLVLVTISLFSSTLLLLAQQDGVQASVARGEKVYKMYCLTCHQVTGGGVPHMNPPLIKTSYVTGDKKNLIQWVLKGSTQNIPIDGKDYSNNMAPQSFLRDQDIADVLTYIRNSFGNKSSAVTAEEVSAVRAATK